MAEQADPVRRGSVRSPACASTCANGFAVLILGSFFAFTIYSIDEPRFFRIRLTAEAGFLVPVDAAVATPFLVRSATLTSHGRNLMFAYLLGKLDNWFERAQQRSLDSYLATSSDLQELERRMRSTERNGYPTQIK
jgi:hypothetical protein